MTNLQAALGVAQLERLDAHIQKNREIGRRYLELLRDLPDVALPLEKTDYAENIYWVYGIVLSPKRHVDRQQITQRLRDAGIGTRPFFWPMHEQPILLEQGFAVKSQSHPFAEHLARWGFYIPSGLGLTPQDQAIVSDALHDILCQ